MGVPAFFRWLSRKYPSIVVNAVEERSHDIDDVRVPVDATQPNPNFQEFDNLYLDMNGIIHPCCHPEDRPAPKDENEMMVLIFEYIDRLFSIIRPRKLLYMAIDGVAPRAKMNQQRSRRFRSSKETADRMKEIADVRRRLEAEGIPLPPPKTDDEHFDSNCITPGTPFMARLADALHYYIHSRLNTDPAWSKIQVILSDANAPGEGEHKIMDYIRKQRASPSHDPNTVHCLCGADADLIMLGLATHEPNFCIIREEFVPNQQRPCELCGQYGHDLKGCQGLARDEIAPDQADPIQKEKNFIFLRLNILREYLEKELYMPNLPFKFDLERAVDDWVFMCFFVGNDFLPHLPSLEIREGAIDRLIKLYKEMAYKTNGYLTEDGNVNLERVQLILTELGAVEDEIFKRRQENELQFRARNKAKRRRERAQTAPAWIPANSFGPTPVGGGSGYGSGIDGNTTRHMARDMRVQAMQFSTANAEAAKQLKSLLKPVTDDKQRNESTNRHSIGNAVDATGRKRTHQQASGGDDDDDDEEDEVKDEIRLWEDGWKERYYQAKFEVSSDDIGYRRRVATAYVEGLCWVMKYYYQGCASWKWYFPFHYAPFASDFDCIADISIDLDSQTQPFRPLEQLMSVFPAASRKHLPACWHHLMTDIDSPIIDFYPDDFQIDLNGKKFAWQGVALLPFVDERRLLATLTNVYDRLDVDECARNMTSTDRLFVGSKHPAYAFIKELYDGAGDESIASADWIDIDAQFTHGMAGRLGRAESVVLPGTRLVSPIPDPEQCPDIETNQAIVAQYLDPSYARGHIFSADRLAGAVEPAKTLKPTDWDERQNGRYRPQIGFSRDIGRAALSNSGHRMINYEMMGSGRGDFIGNERNRGSFSGRGNYDNHMHRGQQHGYQHPRSNAYSGGNHNQQSSWRTDDRQTNASYHHSSMPSYHQQNRWQSPHHQSTNYAPSRPFYNNAGHFQPSRHHQSAPVRPPPPPPQSSSSTFRRPTASDYF